MQDVMDIENEAIEAGHRTIVRRSAMWGAVAGFFVGLFPLIASIGMGAIAGAVIAKMSQMRLDRGRPPSIHFVHRQEQGDSLKRAA